MKIGGFFIRKEIYALYVDNHTDINAKKIFKEIQHLNTFYTKITSPLGGGNEIYKNFVSLPYRCYIPNLVRLTQYCYLFYGLSIAFCSETIDFLNVGYNIGSRLIMFLIVGYNVGSIHNPTDL